MDDRQKLLTLIKKMSDEEIELLTQHLIIERCPSNYGLKNSEGCDENIISCKDCWENALS